MATARQRGDRWTGLYRDHNGRQKSAGTFDSKKAALTAARAHDAAEKSGRNAKQVFSPPGGHVNAKERRGKPTVAGYAPGWLAGHQLEETSRATYECMLKHIVRGLGNVTLCELDTKRVRAFFRQLEMEGKAASTIGLVMTTLREMCRTAIIDGDMDRDPTQNVKIKSRHQAETRILSPAEYRLLLNATPDHYKLLVRTLVSTGLRWGEAMGLQSRDVMPRGDGYVVSVRRVQIEVDGRVSVRNYGKTAHATRTITIDSDLAEALITAGKSDPDGFIFRAEKGGVLHRSNFRRVFIRIKEKAGISGVRVHDLRHTHASWLVENGADLVTVRDRLGHSNIAVTSRYLHVVPGEDDKALAALSRAMAA